MAGTRRRVENDDQLLEQMSLVLDSLYAHFASNGKNEVSERSRHRDGGCTDPLIGVNWSVHAASW